MSVNSRIGGLPVILSSCVRIDTRNTQHAARATIYSSRTLPNREMMTFFRADPLRRV